jgi:hypothetical protein
MAIAYVSVSNGQADTVSSITVSHVVASGSDRLLVAKTHQDDTTTPTDMPVTGITYNSVAMTKADDHDTTGAEKNRIELWYLVAPDEGTYNCVATFTNTIDACMLTVENYTGVKQTSPLNVTGSAFAISAGPAQVSITTTVADCLIVDMVHATSSSRTFAVNSGQTSTYNVQQTGAFRGAGAYEIVTTATSYTQGWTINTTSDWLAIASAFEPVVVAGGATYAGYYGYGQNY